jgi:hypothetical protein
LKPPPTLFVQGESVKKKEQTSKTFVTPSEKHMVAKLTDKQSKKIIGESSTKDPIKSKNEAIQNEKKASIKKTGITPNNNEFDTRVFAEEDNGPFPFITLAVKQVFKLTEANFKEMISQWNFPHAIGDVHRKHKVYRFYCQPSVNLLVDVFDARTSQDEINRIKAHLESIGYQYTYFKGGEEYSDADGQITEKFKKLLFEDRVKPVDLKALKKPLNVPTNLEQAGINNTVVIQ